MIEKLLENIKDNFKKYIMDHIGTNIILLVLAITILVIDLDSSSDFVPRTLATLFLTAMFTVLGETFTKENKKRYIIYGIGFLVSIFASKWILEKELSKYFLGIVFSVGFTVLYLMAKNSKEPSTKYLTSTVTNLFKLGIIGCVLNMGIMSILGIISALLVEVDEMVFVKTEIIVFVLYYIPALIISLETKEKENKFIYSLVNHVALPLISIATIIIYIYIIKLLVTLKLPHTQTFAINTALLCCGIPIVLMVLSYDKNTMMTKIANFLKKLYIPLVVLQIFALSLRIHAYGITVSRYFGIIVIILEIISLVLLNKDNGKNYKMILLPCIGISIVCLIFPYINIYEYPNYAQINRLKQILPEGKNFDSLTKKEKENVRSIYYYVDNEKYYPKYLPKKELQRLLRSYDDYGDSGYIYYHSEQKRINVENYKEIEEISIYSNEGFTISINNESYNLEEYCKNVHSYKQENDNVDDYIENNKIIELDNKIDLYITNLQLNYLDNYITIDGYILYK